MVEYRAYSVDHDGHFVGFALVCADDGEAIEKANRLADRCAIELWRRTIRDAAGSQDCESALGPDADRRVKLLIQFAVEGSLSGAYLHYRI